MCPVSDDSKALTTSQTQSPFPTHSLMRIDPERTKLVFRRMDRQLRGLASSQQPEAVHDFRTTSRRLEILLGQLTSNHNGNHKKLLKALGRIRKRAGKVRDLDAQLAALRSLKVPQEPRRKTQLIQHLIELRVEHEKKLRKQLSKSDVRKIQKRLKRAARDLQLDRNREPLTLVQEILGSVSASAGQIDDKVLHQYRIAVKQARYAAEFAMKSAESIRIMTELERLQDALGHWHDWLTLTQTAAARLGEVGQSSLVAALHNVTRGKYRHAVAALATLSKRKEPVPPIPAKRSVLSRQAQSSSSESKTAA